MQDWKYQQLQDAIKAELKSGRFKPGDRFYTDRELMQKYQMSTITVNRALAELVEQGYFERRRKLGTIVLESPMIPGMAGDIMTRPLYTNGMAPGELRAKNPSWFVVDEVRRGIINSYPGPVRIEPFSRLKQMKEAKQDFLSVIVETAGVESGFEETFKDGIIVDVGHLLWQKQNVVTYEILSGIFEAVRYLVLSLQRRRIGFVGGSSVIHHGKRYAAYRIALEALEIPFDESLVVRHAGDGVEATRRLLALPQPPDAILLDNDLRAMDAVEMIQAAGLRIPEDIAIIGADDMPGADTFIPSLTTVRVPFFEMGQAAVEMLMQRLKTGGDAPSRVFHCDLKIRNSTNKTING